MEDGQSPEVHLREMAAKCRAMADLSVDEREAASLRRLAQEYEKAAEAALEATSYIGPAGSPGIGT